MGFNNEELKEKISALLDLERDIALKDAGVNTECSVTEAVDSMSSDEDFAKEDSSECIKEYISLRSALSKDEKFIETYTEIKRTRNKDARRALKSSYPSYCFTNTTVIPFFNADGTHDPIEEGKDY